MGDLLLLIVLTLFVYAGYKKGFLRTLTGMLSFVISFALAFWLSGYMPLFLTNFPFAKIKILSAVTIFVIVRVLIYTLIKVCGFIRKLPLIGTCDGLLGALLGAFRGLVVVYILVVLAIFSTQLHIENRIFKTVNQSEFAEIVYNNNVFVDFLKND